MQYKTLGDTGLLVSRLCLGTMTFSGGQGYWRTIGTVDQAGADELVRASIEAGINFVDTADVYSEGESEKMLAQSLKNLAIARKDFVIATKAFGRTGPGRNDMGASRAHLMNAVEASLRRLNTDYIDLYQLHGADLLTPMEETLRALDALVAHGKVRYIGCSNWPAWRIMKAAGVAELRNLSRFVTTQAYYSLASRDLEREVVPMLQDQKIGLLVWSPLAGGLLSGKFTRDEQSPKGSRRAILDFPVVDKDRVWKIVDVLIPLARERGVSPATVALAWVLSKPYVTSVIIGAKNLGQLADNLAANEFQLSEHEIEQLDAVSALPLEYPGWMVARQNEGRSG